MLKVLPGVYHIRIPSPFAFRSSGNEYFGLVPLIHTLITYSYQLSRPRDFRLCLSPINSPLTPIFPVRSTVILGFSHPLRNPPFRAYYIYTTAHPRECFFRAGKTVQAVRIAVPFDIHIHMYVYPWQIGIKKMREWRLNECVSNVPAFTLLLHGRAHIIHTSISFRSLCVCFFFSLFLVNRTFSEHRARIRAWIVLERSESRGEEWTCAIINSDIIIIVTTYQYYSMHRINQ